ncbi:MAG TPA: FtsX-like permease family protein [Candidatus Eisenbacteria bacterium]|nr:FtsX-like permease family protein [Candidatus Eisenbacteria bacterium]
MAIPLSYNIRNVIQRPLTTLATGSGIAMVVMILIGAFALASGFQAALVETGSPDNAFIRRTGADSEISSGVGRDAAAIIGSLPDVATGPDGRPLISKDLVVLTNLERVGQTGSSNVTIRGIDPSSLTLRPQMKVTAGRMFAPGTDEVIVGERTARRFQGLGINGKVMLGQQSFTVVGHFTAGGSAFESEIWGDNAVLMPALDRNDAFQSITFRMRPAGPGDQYVDDKGHRRSRRFDALKNQLENDRRLGVQVQTEREFYASQSALLAGVIRGAGVFITLIMAIGAIFGAMNTMYAAVGQRTREIAVLQTLGFTPGSIMMSFLFESVFLALIGGVLGCILALPINGITTSTTNWASFSEVAFAFRVTPIGMAIGLAFAAIMGVVGGFLPARQAARQSLAATLRAA